MHVTNLSGERKTEKQQNENKRTYRPFIHSFFLNYIFVQSPITRPRIRIIV